MCGMVRIELGINWGSLGVTKLGKWVRVDWDGLGRRNNDGG